MTREDRCSYRVEAARAKEHAAPARRHHRQRTCGGAWDRRSESRGRSCSRSGKGRLAPPIPSCQKTVGSETFCRLRSCSGGLCAELHKEGGALAKKAAELYTEPMGWVEEQFRAAGHEEDSRELAVHLFCSFQGMAAVAHGANDPDVVVMEVKRLKDWIRTL